MVIPKKPEDGQEIYGPAEACWYLNRMDWKTFKRHILPNITYKRIGRQYLISKASLDEFLNEDKFKARELVKRILN